MSKSTASRKEIAGTAMAKEKTDAIEELRGIMDKESLMKGDFEIGIDEAGRGPVFGPMVYGGCAWPMSCRSTFSKVGFKDSKQLTEEERDTLFALINEFDTNILHQKAVVSSPLDITYSQLAGTRESLNTFSHNCAITIIKHFLSLGLRITHAFLDTVGDPDKYRRLLEDEFQGTKPKIDFTVTSKADDLFPVVSAASIVAKVTRDRAIKDTVLREKIEVSRDFGSGYPGDPITVKWLNDHFDQFFGYPSVVRFSWSTITNRLANAKIEYNFSLDCNMNRGTVLSSFDTKPKPKLAKRLNLKSDYQI